MYLWKPKTEADYLKVFEIGPRSCMSLDRHYRQVTPLDPKARWDMHSFYDKNLHPGLWYFDNPHVEIWCVADSPTDPSEITGRINVWTVDGVQYLGSPYGRHKREIVHHALDKGVQILHNTLGLEFPTYSVEAREINWNGKHFIMPWAFCDDLVEFIRKPEVGFDDGRFGVVGYPFDYKGRSLQIRNSYAFEGYISHLDIDPPWRIPDQDYNDARLRTAEQWDLLG